MIPPTSPALLEKNPQFALLHNRLTTEVLNPDASSKALTNAHTSTSRALRVHRLRVARNHVLLQSLRDAANKKGERRERDILSLPAETRQVLATAVMILAEAPHLQLSEDDYDLLQPDIDAFNQLIPTIAACVSADLKRKHATLCKIATPSSSDPHQPSKLASRPPAQTILTSLITPILPHIPHPPLQSALSTLTTLLTAHATLHRHLLTSTLTHLERVTLGLHARHSRARSAHLHAVAAGLAKKIQVLYLGTRKRVYEGEGVQGALGRYARHLEGVKGGLEEREMEVREALEEFDAVGEVDYDDGDGEGERGGLRGNLGLMREVGRRYGELLREIKEVKGEIERVERSEVLRKGRK